MPLRHGCRILSTGRDLHGRRRFDSRIGLFCHGRTADEEGMFGSPLRHQRAPESVHPVMDKLGIENLGVEKLVTETLYRCPCCGYRTLAAPESLQLCPVCWWEDDGQEDADASEVRLTVNGSLSLDEARIHFRECGAAHPRFLRYVRKPLASEQ
jgi:Cysteine-rich CPCC